MSCSKESVYDQLLVLRCQKGDTQALEELVERWEPRLFYYVRRLVDHEVDAWDVLQKTWLKVMRGISQLRDAQSLPAWMYTLARRTAIDHGRQRLDRHLPLTALEMTDEPPDDMDSTLIFDNAEAVHSALERLSRPHREVLTLFFLQDLSIDQIADVIGVAAGTVKSRLYYARRALRETMGAED